MRSGFFNSEIIGYDIENMPIFDRAEEASFFAKYFAQFISNGVFPNPSTNMQVLATDGMIVKVDTGTCFINGYMGWVEHLELIELEESDYHPRFDLIVARLDYRERRIELYVKKGVAGGNAVMPTVQRDFDIYEIALACIAVEGNTIEIKQSNIVDLRLNSDVCGIVANHLQHLDTTTLFNQYQDWLVRVTGQAEIDLEKYKNDLMNDIELFKDKYLNWFNSFKSKASSEFYNWFNSLKYTLDGDVAGHLMNLIDEKASKNEVNELKIICKDLEIPVDYWFYNSTANKYICPVNDTDIRATDKIDIVLDENSLKSLQDAIYEDQDSHIDYYFRLATGTKPTTTLKGKMYIQRTTYVNTGNTPIPEVIEPVIQVKEYEADDKYSALLLPSNDIYTITNFIDDPNDENKIIVELES